MYSHGGHSNGAELVYSGHINGAEPELSRLGSSPRMEGTLCVKSNVDFAVLNSRRTEFFRPEASMEPDSGGDPGPIGRGLRPFLYRPRPT